MPTISIKKSVLDKHFNCVYSQEEIEEMCFGYGLEVDDVIKELNVDGFEEETFKIEVPANRYDLLCVEGFCQALLIFYKKINVPIYNKISAKNRFQITVDSTTETVRPYVGGAILRGINLDKNIYSSFIDLQDKLHQNICRKRTLVAIGTHDLDKITGNVYYTAKKPEEIVFCPLNQTQTYDAKSLMDLYSNSYLRDYLPIIQNKDLYPVFYDESNTVLSLPPIINGDKTKLTMDTKNIFIEATATNLKKLEIVIDTIVTMFSQYCSVPFTIEPVDVIYPNGIKYQYPILEYRKLNVNLETINSKIGINLTSNEALNYLTKMSLSSSELNLPNLEITIPPTRHDIIHECDVAEDLGLAYGFNNITPLLPQSNTIAKPFFLNKMTDALRFNIAMCGWTEVLNFALCSCEDVSNKLRKSLEKNVVKILNPKTKEFQVVRNSLLPGILKTLSYNKDMPLPLKLFEIQDVVFKDKYSDTKSKNERHLAVVYYGKNGNFGVLHGFLDRIMQLLEVRHIDNISKKNLYAYYIKETNDSLYFTGRCAEVIVNDSNTNKSFSIGKFGILHPEVLNNFNLNMLCAALEINIELFL